MTQEEESKEYPRRVGGHEGRSPAPGAQAVGEASGGRKIPEKGLEVIRSSLDASPTTAAAPKPKASAIGLSKANESRRKAKIINPNASDPSCRPVDAVSSNHGLSIPKNGMGLSKANRNRKTNQVDLNVIMDHCLDEEHGETQERHWVKDYCLDDESGEIEDTVPSLPNHTRSSESAAESVPNMMAPRLVECMATDNVASQDNPAPSMINDSGPSLGDSPPPASDASNGLAVASLVSQHPQAHAEEVDEEEQQATARAKKQDAIRRTFLWVGGGLLTTVVILLLVLFVPRKENALVPENETIAQAATLQENVIQLVSNVSQEESFLDADSPQSKALQWILEDPALSNYSDWRIQQRYILATFYFATGGPKWSLNANWLNHSVHECQWQTYKSYVPPLFELAMGTNLALSRTARAIDGAPCGDSWETSGVFKYLFLMANHLTGSVPDEIFRLFSLRGINLSVNSELQGAISTEIALLTDLQVLGFVNNPRIQGTIPTQMGLLSHLTDFNIWNSPITGTLPSELGMLSNSLQMLVWDNYLLVDHAGMQGTIPTQIGRLAPLEVLLLTGGEVTGTVPIETLVRLKNLTYLDLRVNSMTGPIPSQIGLLTSTTYLNLRDNSLTGPIPSQIGLLTSTTGLILHNNSLTGPIPSELGLLTDIRRQSLRDNLLTSTIPSELGLMKDIHELFLSNNTLIGQVPSQLGLLTNCTLLWLHDNELSGAMPEALCAMGHRDSWGTWHLAGLSFDCKENLCGCSWCPCANDSFGG